MISYRIRNTVYVRGTIGTGHFLQLHSIFPWHARMFDESWDCVMMYKLVYVSSCRNS
ncbi:hypothetical protein I3760_15G069400 [Carya illinoinensis]|nr:hypothetical protein I3760_15G069400 [Carya illinoinensis]